MIRGTGNLRRGARTPWQRWAALMLSGCALYPHAALAAQRVDALHVNEPPPIPDGLIPPTLADEISLEYPAELAGLERPPEGDIGVRVVIGVDGLPLEVSVTRGLHPLLDELATGAVRAAAFIPGTYKGAPVEVAIEINIPVYAPPPAASPPLARPRGSRASDGGGAAPGTRDSEQPTTGGPDGPSHADAPTLNAAPEGEREPPREVFPLQGRIVEAASRRPLSGVTVIVVPAAPDAEVGRVRSFQVSADEEDDEPTSTFETTTDPDGRFEFTDLPDGKIRVVAIASGMRRVEWIESREPNEALNVRYFLEPDGGPRYRTTVEDGVDREEIGRKTLSIAEVATLPGAQGDALRSIQALPGVARPPYGAGLLVIRGAAPFDSAVYLAQHGIPLAFHFGGLSTAVNSDVLESVSFVPSNFDVRWGNAIGGVVSVQPRRGRRDGVHGYVDFDLIDASVLLEGPLHKGSFLASVRRSYIDAILPLVLPEDALQLTRAPRYWDYSLFLDHPLGPGDLSVRFLGGDDQFEFLAYDPNDVDLDDRNRSGARAFVHRADLAWNVKKNGWVFDVSPSVRYELGRGQSGGAFDLLVDRKAMTGRVSLKGPLSRRTSLEIGSETYLLWYRVNAVSAPIQGSAVPGGESFLGPTSPGSLEDQQIEDLSAFSSTLAVYASATLGEGTRVRVVPGVRLTRWGFPMHAVRADPRVRMIWDATDELSVRAGAGLFSQTPVFQDLTPAFGNPDLSPLRAAHTSLEFVAQLPHELELTVSGFFNSMWDLPAPTDDSSLNPDGTTAPVRLRSDGVGRVYGAEMLLRKRLTKSLVGWVSYTLSRSVRAWPGDPSWVPYDYDQTHAVSALAAFVLPRNWRIGGRFRLTSGNPTTPITSAVFDGSTGSYTPLEGPRNSDRLPLFHQLDLRVDKQFYWRYLKLNLYLDLQNTYNRANVEFWTYAYNYREKAPIRGLPILPSLGARLEF